MPQQPVMSKHVLYCSIPYDGAVPMQIPPGGSRWMVQLQPTGRGNYGPEYHLAEAGGSFKSSLLSAANHESEYHLAGAGGSFKSSLMSDAVTYIRRRGQRHLRRNSSSAKRSADTPGAENPAGSPLAPGTRTPPDVTL
jgi:hypothetical protein